MADFNKPTTASTKANFPTEITDLVKDLAKQSSAISNPPTGYIAFHVTNKRWEKYNGATWDELIVKASDKYDINVDKLDGCDDTAFVKHSLATAVSDFLVASGAGAWIKKTLAEVKTILGLNVKTIGILINDSTPLTTGDGKAFFRVPSVLNGMNLTAVAAHCQAASSSGIPTIQIRNVTDSVDMLSTKLTIDAGENDSSTAAIPAVIDTSKDDVATGDWIAIDCDIAGTGVTYMYVEMQFTLP